MEIMGVWFNFQVFFVGEVGVVIIGYGGNWIILSFFIVGPYFIDNKKWRQGRDFQSQRVYGPLNDCNWLLAFLNPRVLADSNLAGYRHTELGDPDMPVVMFKSKVLIMFPH